MTVFLLLACGGPATPPSPPEPPRAQVDEQRPQDNAGEPSTGRWNPARSTTDEAIAALEAIGYVGGEVAATGPGRVSVHTEASQPGYNLYVSGHAAEATLMDAEGTVLHRWAKPFRAIWPDRTVGPNAHGPDFWRRAALLPDGGLLAIYEGHGLVRLDRDSNVVWSWDGLAHHDLEVLPDGSIWVLSRKARVVPALHPKRPVLEDFATHLSASGEVLQQISILEAAQQGDARGILEHVPRRFGDVFHTNSLEVLTGSVPHPGFEAGNLLLSMRAPSTLAVLDPRSGAITWWHHGDYAKQHDPTILDNGHLLLFDNLGAGATSAVEEYRLPEMEQVWSWSGSEDTPFFSRFCGASQRLANGNTLISESGVGHVIEVTPSGEVVWAWDNPARAGEAEQFVAIVPELIRVAPADVPWLTVEGVP